MKLKLTKMKLNNDGVIKGICDILRYNKNMISLDLSFGSLTPKYLKQIAQELTLSGFKIRNLNLSYN